jgi:L-fuconolactonase
MHRNLISVRQCPQSKSCEICSGSPTFETRSPVWRLFLFIHIMRIDSHQHFWEFDPVRDSWINDEMKAIQRDFVPTDLEPLLKQYGFDGSVVIQSDQSAEENRFQLHNAAGNDFIKGVVGWVDVSSPSVEKELEHLSQFPKMKGFRHILQGEAQRDYMLRPVFMKGISFLRKYNFTYDILIFPDQLQYIPQFVSSFPSQQFVIDHIAKPDIRNGKIDEWKRGIEAIAQYDNVHCKLSGMVTEADWKNWKTGDFRPYMDTVVESFGIGRLMFGSDWPVCLVAASYKEMLGIVDDYFSSFSHSEQDRFFGLNATRFYNL